jgi:PAP2 superfamily
MEVRHMIDLELSWRAAAVTAACLAGASVAARYAARPDTPPALAGAWPRRLAVAAGVAQEAAVLLALFALWQLAGSFSLIGPGGALARAQWIWHAERVVHLPSEAGIQQAFLGHPLLVQALNLYYASLHFVVLMTCLVWVYVRHRRQYPQVRITLVLFTAGALLVQFLPVAPPRMLAGDGLVDTAARYGQSVYGSVEGFNADQLSAMPSVHVGWALLVALVVVQVSRSRWRWLALGYPLLTLLAVIVTANHFWLDGIAAALLLALALLVQRAGRAVHRRIRSWRQHRGRAGQPGYVPERPSVDAWTSRSALCSAFSRSLARCASSSTYSWLARAMIAYMISSVTARSTSRSDSSPA